jgi:O-antigen ligase
MLNKTIPAYQLWWFAGFALFSLACILGAFAFEQYMALAVPVVLVFGYIAFINYKAIYWLLLFTLPLSTELDIGSVGLDMPDELLMVSLMFITLLAILGKPKLLDFRFVKHPIMLLLLTHFFLVVLLIPYSENGIVTIKYALSKLWFYVPFLILTSMVIKEEADLKKFFWYIFIPMTFTVLYVLVRYAGYGFSFEEVNKPMYPFYRNHVSYACMITRYLEKAHTSVEQGAVSGCYLLLIYPCLLSGHCRYSSVLRHYSPRYAAPSIDGRPYRSFVGCGLHGTRQQLS